MKKIFFILVLSAMTLPFWGHVLVKNNLDKKILYTENRTTTPKPQLNSVSEKAIEKYFKDYGLFITDRLWGKDTISKLVNNYYKNPSYFSSFDLSGGVIGKDGYVFLGNKHSDVIDRHFGDFNINKYKAYSKNFIKKQEVLLATSNKIKAEYLFFLAPDKHTIYSNNFPNWAVKSDKIVDISLKGIEKLNHLGIPIIFPYLELKNNSNNQLYFKTDTHWNHKGAEIAFLSIANVLNLDYANQKSLVLSVGKEKKLGDLKAIVGLPDNFKFEDNKYAFNFDEGCTVFWMENGKKGKKIKVADAQAQGNDSRFFAKTVNPSAKFKKKVFLICDSFGRLLSPFFAYYFEEVFMTSNKKSAELLKNEILNCNPDFIIYEIVERSFIVN